MGPKPQVKILAVDDKPANLVALQAVLDNERYRLVKAVSGAEAIELVQAEDFAAILLDIHMPGLDGYETAKRIKALPGKANIPIIMITAVYKEDDDIRRGYEAGAIDFIAKPFDPGILKAKVGIYAELYLKTKQAREQERLLVEPTEGVIVFGAAGRIVSANEAARRIWSGYASVGQWLKADGGALARLMAKGDSTHETLAISCPDGTRKSVVCHVSPVKNAKGAVVGAVCVARDVT